MELTLNDVNSRFSNVSNNYLTLKEQVAPTYIRSELFNKNDAPAMKSINNFEELLTKFANEYVYNAKNECKHNEFEHTSNDLNKLSNDISSVLEEYEKIKKALSDSSHKAFDEMKTNYDSIVRKIDSNIRKYNDYQDDFSELYKDERALTMSGGDTTKIKDKIKAKLSAMNECCKNIDNGNKELEELIKNGFKRQNQMYNESASDYSINVKNAKNKNFSEISMI